MSSTKILECLRLFHNVDPDATVATFITFSAIRPEGYTHVADLIRDAGFDKSTISRQLAVLSNFGRNNKKGLDLIRIVDDPQDRRCKIVSLTPKGKELQKQINQLFQI